MYPIFVGSVHNFVGLTVTLFIEKNCNTTKWPLWPLFSLNLRQDDITRQSWWQKNIVA